MSERRDIKFTIPGLVKLSGDMGNLRPRLLPFLAQCKKMKSEELPTASLGLGLVDTIPFILLTPICYLFLLADLSKQPLEKKYIRIVTVQDSSGVAIPVP